MQSNRFRFVADVATHRAIAGVAMGSPTHHLAWELVAEFAEVAAEAVDITESSVAFWDALVDLPVESLAVQLVVRPEVLGRC